MDGRRPGARRPWPLPLPPPGPRPHRHRPDSAVLVAGPVGRHPGLGGHADAAVVHASAPGHRPGARRGREARGARLPGVRGVRDVPTGPVAVEELSGGRGRRPSLRPAAAGRRPRRPGRFPVLRRRHGRCPLAGVEPAPGTAGRRARLPRRRRAPGRPRRPPAGRIRHRPGPPGGVRARRGGGTDGPGVQPREPEARAGPRRRGRRGHAGCRRLLAAAVRWHGRVVHAVAAGTPTGQRPHRRRPSGGAGPRRVLRSLRRANRGDRLRP